MASAAMDDHGFDLSLLFATRIPFYGRLGWQSHPRQLVFIEPGTCRSGGDYSVRPFETADLPAVMEIYDTYNAERIGTTVRDDTYWKGHLRYAGNPDEDFLVALEGKRIVAYTRGTKLYDFYVVMEHAHLPGAEAALTQLISTLHGGPAGPLPGTVTHLSTSPHVQRALSAQGLTLRSIEDVFWMWRVVSVMRLAAKLQLDAEDLERDDVFFRLLPPATSVYWTADRF
jgi:hypothetical protein